MQNKKGQTTVTMHILPKPAKVSQNTDWADHKDGTAKKKNQQAKSAFAKPT